MPVSSLDPEPIEVVGQIQSIKSASSCQLEQTRSSKDCVFEFEVSLDQPNTSQQEYIYSLEGSGGKAEDYIFNAGESDVVTYLPDQGSNGRTGELKWMRVLTISKLLFCNC